ncbi:hypothetical protein L596_026295 [Steinernema carpocapsae]|uniref:Armadillo segment polarity protein n=1 Tax=Steinernema carpocapsae TaxID=34508 RepID=A0A4U5M1X4_STECR|nr:hypothetical protein L596_026295 [Steinernema carpocapsae]
MAIDRNGDVIYESTASMPSYHYRAYSDDYSDSRSSRIRNLMFPEFDDVSVQRVQEEFRSSIVLSLADHAIGLRNAVIDLIAYRDEVECSVLSIPSLIEMLGSQDEHVFARAINDVYLLSKKDKKIIANLSSNDRLVGSLISAASRSNDIDIQRKAISALKNFSDNPSGRMLIFRTGGIPQLVAMLSSKSPDVVRYATNTLYNLLVHIEETRDEVTHHGGLPAFTRLLNNSNKRVQAMVADSLYWLMIDVPENKLHFLALQGPTILIKILNELPDWPQLVAAVVRCIKTISTCNQSKGSLIQNGAMEALRIHLETTSETKRKNNILQAIRNLSGAATNVDNLDRLVADLVSMVERHHEDDIISCACGILSNLTCNNVRNKQTVCSNSGIAILCDALQRFAHIEDITEPALCTLRHCTARHILAQQAQTDIRQCPYAFHVLLELLATGRLPIMKACLGLIRNCALSYANLEGINSVRTPSNNSVVEIALSVLLASGRLLLENFDAEDEGIKHLDMVESAVAALHVLAADQNNANFIVRENQSMSVLVCLLSQDEVNNSDDELLMREIMGLIYQLTKTQDNAKILEEHGATQYIAPALHSQHKSIATYSSGILKNLEKNKPLEYQRQLDTEINSAIDLGGEDRFWQHDGIETELFSEMYACNYGNITDIGVDNQAWYDTDL